MQAPICGFDAKNAVLCLKCESKLQRGELTLADIEASCKLANLAKVNFQIDKFTLKKCREIDGSFILYLTKNDILAIRQSRVLYGLIQEQFSGKIWLAEYEESDKKFIEDMFFPTKILSVNSVWAQDGVQKTKAVVSGRYTSKFPIDIDKVIKIIKNVRNLDIEIEFEESGK